MKLITKATVFKVLSEVFGIIDVLLVVFLVLVLFDRYETVKENRILSHQLVVYKIYTKQLESQNTWIPIIPPKDLKHDTTIKRHGRRGSRH